MFTSPYPLELSAAERAELDAMAHSRTVAAGLVQRARVILAIADGEPYGILSPRLELSSTTLTRWRKRFEQHRLAGLADAPRSGRGDRVSPALEAKILALTQQARPKPSTHWTSRSMAVRLGINHMTVHRVWQRAGLSPHRLERYVGSPDPDFEQKATDVLGLYLNPPDHAVVFCVDEKTAIQALDRTDPVLPLSPGRAERHGFEYVRHGTLSLYAALAVGTGRVDGMTAPRHTSADFLTFLDQVMATAPKRKAIHFILDNLSAHKTKAVQAWLAAHPRVTMHYTPTYSSWLNQVESWFARIERDCIARGIFTSTRELKKKLLQYIKLNNQTCQPFVWRYRDPTRRIRATRISTTAR